VQARRITYLGALILIALTVVTGVVVFAIMRRQAEATLSTSLQLSLQSRARLFQAKLDNRLHDVTTIATRPFLVQQLKQINTGEPAPKAKFYLQRGIGSFLKTGFSALEIYDAQGRKIVRAGEFVERPKLRIPLHTRVPAALFWDDGIFLSARAPLHDKGRTVGFIRAQARLPSLRKMLFDVDSLGDTGELVVCGPETTHTMQCFPSMLHPEPFQGLRRVINGRSLPMTHALAGQAGVIQADDYRGHGVVAAYTPLSTNLGMVLKTDQSELFQPIRHQLSYVLPTLALLVLLGVLLLRWLVTPLVRRVVTSEREMREANILLAEKEARIRTIFENVDDGILVLNRQGTIESANPAIEWIFGCSTEEVVGHDFTTLLAERDRADIERLIHRDMDQRNPAIIGAAKEVTAARKDGSPFPSELRITQMNLGDEHLLIAIMRDITQRKLAEERVVHLATHDSLTDLPNRHLLQDRVKQAISHAERNEGTKVALLFIDLDGFKGVNDAHGHDVGDRLLVKAAKRIRSVLRSEDTTARQGGDEFIVALPNVKQDSGAEVVAQKLLDALSAPYRINDHEIRISASIGIALYPDDGADMEMLLARSDAAMYAAKMADRGTYRRCDPQMRLPAES